MPRTIEFRVREVQHPSMGGALAVAFKYDEEVKDAFKAFWKKGQVLWDGAAKVWFVKGPPGGTAMQMCMDSVAQNVAGVTVKLALDLTLVRHMPDALKVQPAPPPRAAAQPQARQAQAPQADAAFFKRRYATVDDWAALWLVQGAPEPVAKAAYRALALIHHPDRGGDPGALQRVNAAWARVEATYQKASA